MFSRMLGFVYITIGVLLPVMFVFSRISLGIPVFGDVSPYIGGSIGIVSGILLIRINPLFPDEE